MLRNKWDTALRSSQVFTPVALAKAMVRAVMRSNPKSWLEPSMGAGVFIGAIAEAGVDPSAIVGLELDVSLMCCSQSAAQLHFGVDALHWIFEHGDLYDAVVGNPPYLSLREVDDAIRRSAMRVLDLNGEPVRLGSNLWVAFLLASVAALNRGGSIAFVLPAAWDYADYAADLRRDLPRKFETFHVFRSARPMFSGVSEGSVVIFGTGWQRPHRYFSRVQCADVHAVCEALQDLKMSTKHGVVARCPVPTNSKAFQLADFMQVRLGGVTGNAKFFTLSDDERKTLGIPAAACKKVLTRARHLQWPSIHRKEWEQLRDRGQKVWLFRPSDRLLANPSVARYLLLPTASGGCDRSGYKVASREPWHRTPLPSRADAFVSGMMTRGPVIVFNEFRGLSATNTLYVVEFSRELSLGQRRNLALQLLEERVREQVYLQQRTYAGGMKKMEPSDLARLRVDRPVREVGAKEYASGFAEHCEDRVGLPRFKSDCAI